MGGDRATDMRIANVSIVSANTEYSYKFSANCARIQLQNRNNNNLIIATETGKVAGPTAPYQTLKAGGIYFEQGLNTSQKLYFAGSAGDVVEILYWL